MSDTTIQIKAEKSEVRIIPFDIRCLVYSYFDLIQLINIAAKISKEDHVNLPHLKNLCKSRNLLITINNEGQLIFEQMKYCIQICSKVDLRIVKFAHHDAFLLGAILSLCKQYEKKIELNIWVDKDLDAEKFVNAFNPQRNMNIVDFVYYRLDFKNWSSKLRELTMAFNKAPVVRLSEAYSTDAYIDTNFITM